MVEKEGKEQEIRRKMDRAISKETMVVERVKRGQRLMEKVVKGRRLRPGRKYGG